jgi:NAD(P)H dehydrogenase (quinone)
VAGEPVTTASLSAPLIAVSGASGRLGRKVAQRLSARGVPQRLLVRDLARVPQLPGATAAVAAYADGGAARTALDGVHTLFMVSAFESPTRVQEHRTFIDAAVAAGVRPGHPATSLEELLRHERA